MYKTCFECPHIRIKNQKGRPSFYCPKLTEILGKYFFISNMGNRPRICPLLKKNRGERRRGMKDNNGDGQVDRDKLNKEKEPKKLDITAEVIKLYHNDPISRSVIQYMLSKYKIIPINAIESIKLHREELLLNIVLIYKKMWDARGTMMMKTLQAGGKPMRIVIKERGKDESTEHGKQTQDSGKDGEIKKEDTKEESEGDSNKSDSNRI